MGSVHVTALAVHRSRRRMCPRCGKESVRCLLMFVLLRFFCGVLWMQRFFFRLENPSHNYRATLLLLFLLYLFVVMTEVVGGMQTGGGQEVLFIFPWLL